MLADRRLFVVEPVSLDVNLATLRFDAEDGAMLGVR